MQFDLSDFTQKDIIVLGKDKETASFEQFITKHANIRSLAFLSEEDGPHYLDKLEKVDEEQSVVVKSAGVPGRLVNVAYTSPTKIFLQCAAQMRARTIGVAGTRGKSTTSALIEHFLKSAGYPALVSLDGEKWPLELLESATGQSIFVIEMSSQMLEGLDISPNVGVLTNLDREHVEHHGSLENYWAANGNILRNMVGNGLFVYDPTTEIALHWLAEIKLNAQAIDPNEVVDLTQTQLIGDFAKRDYLLARTVAQSFGIDRLTCQNALRSFQPLPHRMQTIRIVRGVRFIDDAIASSPKNASEAIMSLVRQVGPVGCVMLGGEIADKEEFESLIKLLSTLLIPKIVVFPTANEQLKSSLSDGYEPEVFETDDMIKAVNWAGSHTPSGSVCLLSTAGDTSKLWKDYEEKGNQFQYAVNSLPS